MLVDGKEFFGSDKKVATKNLTADAVDKIEVFDKKSYEAEFSEIDDGVRHRIINLILKEDAKSGSFAEINAGEEQLNAIRQAPNYTGLTVVRRL